MSAARSPLPVVPRIDWAVRVVAPEPGEDLLEIGCGQGAAVAAVYERLRSGKGSTDAVGGSITAMDRSVAAIASARRRNRVGLDAGMVFLRAEAFADTDFGARTFDKIFAINVSFFWRGDGAELPRVRELLRPDGLLYVFHQPPPGGSSAQVSMRITTLLAAHDFAIVDMLEQDMTPAPTLAVCAART